MSPLLEARKLSAGYGDAAAVRDLDFALEPGEIVALVGPNGAGKTTTLRALAGVLSPQAGEVRLNGRPTRAPVYRRVREGMAYLPEERSVFGRLTTTENLRIGRGDMAAALRLFPELEAHQRRAVGLLSGGQQQMLALGRALACDPKVLLADELSIGLAPMIVSRLLAAIREAADQGLGVLLVEQHVHQAFAIADRVIVIQRGRFVLEGPPADMLDRIHELKSAYFSELPEVGDLA